MKRIDKLVRDNIPQFIEDGGNFCYARRINNTPEYSTALHTKMLEEIQEFMSAPSLEEAGDMIEVVKALCTLNDLNFDDALRAAEAKVKTHGGFEGGVFLECVLYESR